jgi:hypothetical protein
MGNRAIRRRRAPCCDCSANGLIRAFPPKPWLFLSLSLYLPTHGSVVDSSIVQNLAPMKASGRERNDQAMHDHHAHFHRFRGGCWWAMFDMFVRLILLLFRRLYAERRI